MIGTKEWKKQNGESSDIVKRRNDDAGLNPNPCGGCSACHQMTGIHATPTIPAWGGDGGHGSDLQKPCATNFFQRNMGNSYMQAIAKSSVPTLQRKCACGGSCASCAEKEDELGKIQTKLTIGPANDVYEQEADRVADQIMRMPDSFDQYEDNQSDVGINIQRILASGDSLDTDSDIQLNLNDGQPLPSSTRQFMEPRFGMDFGHVRLHTDQDAHQTASQIQAKAFTYGHHIWLGKGESEQDKNIMAHELTHVVQQNNNIHKLLQRRCGETTPPTENHPTIRAEIVNQASSRIDEHYLWGTEGERPGLGDVTIGNRYPHEAKNAGNNCYCAGRHDAADVTALPQVAESNPQYEVAYENYAWYREDFGATCGGGCGANVIIYGEACNNHRHFDCSGFVHWCYNQAGYNINRNTVAGYQGCDRDINQAALQPGDLCYIGNTHVGIYAGGNQVVEARAHNFGVVLSTLADRGWDSYGSLF